MKKTCFCLLILLSASLSYAATPLHNEVRSLYQKAVFEEQSCLKLVQLLQPYNEKNNTLLAGYKACAMMLMAKHLLNPFRKLSSFSEGKNLLERSINADQRNAELRFLRFSIQTNAPAFLEYNKNIAEDKAFLLNAIPEITSTRLKQIITDYLNTSEYLTSYEKKQLNQ